MSKLSKIRAAEKTVEIGGQEFEIKPLNNEEFLRFVDEFKEVEDSDSGEKMDVTMRLVTAILQKDDPDITEEEVRDAPVEVTVKVMDAVEEVNGLQDFLNEAQDRGRNLRK